MKKKTKDQCILESSLEKWENEETARLAAKGKDDKFYIITYNKMNEGTIRCEDYTMKFNRSERLIDLAINGEEDSPIWKDVIDNVPARFASCLNCNSNFVFHFSNKLGDEMGFYEYAFRANGHPVFAEVSYEWAAPIFERCFSR